MAGSFPAPAYQEQDPIAKNPVGRWEEADGEVRSPGLGTGLEQGLSWSEAMRWWSEGSVGEGWLWDHV